jgi:hypothetical protein
MEITKTHAYQRERFQQQAVLPVPKESETPYPFQWLIFKPQLHAVVPFQTNEDSRATNTQRTSGPAEQR